MYTRGITSRSVFALTATVASLLGGQINIAKPEDGSNIVNVAPVKTPSCKEIYEQLQVENNKTSLSELINFHNEKDFSNGKICRAYIPPDPTGKPLYVLVMGQSEPLWISSEISAMTYFYEKLIRENKGIVLLFRTGLVMDELNTMANPKIKQTYEPNEVLNNTKTVIEDFTYKFKPSELRMSGFSWGGGTIKKLTEENNWRRGIPVKRTVMIDPITLGSLGFGCAMRTRPEFDSSPDHRNCHIYQRRDNVSALEWVTTLQGDCPIKTNRNTEGKLIVTRDERPGDLIWQVPDTSHLEVERLQEVRQRGYEFLTSQ